VCRCSAPCGLQGMGVVMPAVGVIVVSLAAKR
jgi:hypothetical protein